MLAHLSSRSPNLFNSLGKRSNPLRFGHPLYSVSNGTTRVEHSAQQKSTMHGGLRNKPKHTQFNVCPYAPPPPWSLGPLRPFGAWGLRGYRHMPNALAPGVPLHSPYHISKMHPPYGGGATPPHKRPPTYVCKHATKRWFGHATCLAIASP